MSSYVFQWSNEHYINCSTVNMLGVKHCVGWAVWPLRWNIGSAAVDITPPPPSAVPLPSLDSISMAPRWSAATDFPLSLEVSPGSQHPHPCPALPRHVPLHHCLLRWGGVPPLTLLPKLPTRSRVNSQQYIYLRLRFQHFGENVLVSYILQYSTILLNCKTLT